MRKSKIICIDIETTGLDRNNDEILQVSIINGRGKTLYNSYIKPDYTTEWKEAEAINKISWDCVKFAPGILTEKRRIDKILRKAGLIIGYNHKGFDLPFLAAKGIDTAVKAKIYDVMLEFAYIAGEYNEKHNSYKWKPLTYCAKYYGYTDYKAHDALEDVRATLHCYYAMKKDRRGQKIIAQRKQKERERLKKSIKEANRSAEQAIHDIECERSKARADYNVQSGAEIVKEAREKAGLL
ncbi:MAG: 3'-5' exonuclease [Eubacterium sp.]|jgi:DNA polymerase-3 subunit epsilon|nr:3'-5' exonuclease [Eubacterium sp.]DAY52288.1 MAG TPA: DNA polymerase III subunit alpha [Caudoviricetes sp.]